jgi:hypothetical protein
MVYSSLGEFYRRWRSHLTPFPDLTPRDLCESLASSPLEWLGSKSRIVLRHEPEPLIALLGDVHPLEKARFEASVQWMEGTLERTSVYDHTAVQRLSTTLAEMIRGHLGDQLKSAQFEAIPRGGAFVNAYLSYMLDKSPEHPDGDGVLVIVDDAAFSGRRISERLARHKTGDVVIATLVSPPEVREAIRKRLSQVEWISATDMTTYGSLAAHEDERDPPPWSGVTQHVAFPWTEADRGLRLAGDADFFSGFRLIPPRYCLKNQQQFAGNEGRAFIQNSGEGIVRCAPSVLWAHIGETDRTHVLDTKRDEAFVLEGAAVDFWSVSLASATPDAAVDQLANIFDVSKDTILADHTDFLRSMQTRGIIEVERSSP